MFSRALAFPSAAAAAAAATLSLRPLLRLPDLCILSSRSSSSSGGGSSGVKRFTRQQLQDHHKLELEIQAAQQLKRPAPVLAPSGERLGEVAKKKATQAQQQSSDRSSAPPSTALSAGSGQQDSSRQHGHAKQQPHQQSKVIRIAECIDNHMLQVKVDSIRRLAMKRASPGVRVLISAQGKQSRGVAALKEIANRIRAALAAEETLSVVTAGQPSDDSFVLFVSCTTNTTAAAASDANNDTNS